MFFFVFVVVFFSALLPIGHNKILKDTFPVQELTVFRNWVTNVTVLMHFKTAII